MKLAFPAIFLTLLLSMGSACSASPSKANRLVQQGCLLGRRGNYHGALAKFNQAIACDRSCFEAYYSRAATYLNLCEPERALNDLNKILAQEPNATNTRRARALVLTRMGEWRKAIQDYTVLIKSSKKKASDYANRAALFAHLGDEHGAQKDWLEATRLEAKYGGGCFGHYERYRADKIEDCERDCRFAGKLEKVPAGCAVSELDDWSRSDKMVFAEIFCKIKARCPGLIERATNGERLNLCFSHSSKFRTGMDSASGFHCITLYADCFSERQEELEWMLLHELVHHVDVVNYISEGKEFSATVTPVIMRCRNHYKQFDWSSAYRWSGSQRLDPRALPHGLPTLYAALNRAEALADCTTANILYRWSPPSNIDRLIHSKILAPLSGVDVESSLLCQATVLYYDNNPKAAIPKFTQVLRLDPTCVPALSALDLCWGQCGEPDISRYYHNTWLRTVQ